MRYAILRVTLPICPGSNGVFIFSMCGDHPSFTKTELNAKEDKPEDRASDKKDKPPATNGRISPTVSQFLISQSNRITTMHRNAIRDNIFEI